MNRSLITLACVAAFTLAACSQQSADTAADTGAENALAESTESAPLDVIPTGEGPSSDFDQRGFAGTFAGTVPCADCPGMDVTLVLEGDGTYNVTHVYQGRPDGTWSIGGHWSVESDNGVIRLDPNSKTEEDQLYAIDSPSRVVMLNAEGNPIESGADYGLSRVLAQ